MTDHRPHHYAQKDRNQSDLVRDMRRLGMYVQDTSPLGGEVLDLLVAWRGVVLPVEVKRPGHEGELTDDERMALQIYHDIGVPAVVATRVEDVLEAFHRVLD